MSNNHLKATESPQMRKAKHDEPAPSIPPLHRAIRGQLDEAVERAVASAQTAYAFSPGSYTAKALSDAVTVQKKLKWLDDLDDGVSR
jgi:hypothetical protein